MAVKAYYLDKRVLKTPTIGGELANLQNVLNLKDYVQDVVDSTDITFDTIVLEDGTAALPSLTNDGDLNTGLYFPSADNIGLTTGGTLRANVSSAGVQVTGALTTTTSVTATTSVLATTTVTGTTGVITNTVSELTAASGVTVDSVLLKDGGVSNSAGTIFADYKPILAQNNITAGTGGAIAITNYLTTINTDAGGDSFTLANATQIGQVKKILLVADGGGDAVITPTALSGGTTITMNDAADYVILKWTGAAWIAVENSGCTIA